MAATMNAYELPASPRPAVPAANTTAASAPMRVSDSAPRIPANTTTRNPGSSRGNSRPPRTSAVIWKVSER